jgi:hypothetical protein
LRLIDGGYKSCNAGWVVSVYCDDAACRRREMHMNLLNLRGFEVLQYNENIPEIECSVI